MKIVSLSSENVLRLSAVEIKPDGELVVIGGRNEQGKTSVLDSIVLALGGRQATATVPLKKGTKKGKVVVDLGNLIVSRTFTAAGGGQLKVSTKDGATYSSPQKMLDDLTGQLTFDPLAWSKMDGKNQLNVIKGMVGLDFTDLDAKRKVAFDNRTDINRDIKAASGAVELMEEHEGVPTEVILIIDLIKELETRKLRNENNTNEKNWLCNIQSGIDGVKIRIEEIDTQIEDLKADIEELATEKHEKIAALADIEKKQKVQAKIVEKLKPEDEEEIKLRLITAEVTNAKIRANKERAEKQKRVEALKITASDLTAHIEKIDTNKADQLAAAEFPIEQMSFDETGVLYKDVPFSQASSAERLRVSVAMGIAMNPDLKVLLIRDGSLLDEDNLAAIASMAKESGHQIWIERVGDGKECSVIIEDGMVRE